MNTSHHTGAASRLRSRGGFTLVEIMIAIGIFGMIMVAIYASWSAILRGAKMGQDAASEAQRARMAMRCIEDALVSCQLFNENIQHYAFITDTSSDFAVLSLAAHLPKSFPGSGMFGDQVVRRVTFTVEPGADRVNQLVMRQMPLLAATNAAEDLSYTLPIAPDVSAFTLEFLDVNRGEWVRDWFHTNQLPKIVRVSLGFGHANQYFSRPREVFTRDIALSAIAIPVEYQMGTAIGVAGNRSNVVRTPTPPPNQPRQ